MKHYYYILFYLYSYYKKREPRNEGWYYLFLTSITSTLLVCLNLMAVIFILEYLDIVKVFYSKYHVVFFVALVWIINYYFFVKNEKFLELNFKKDKKGGWIIVLYVIFSFLSVIYAANLNRNKIAQEKKLLPKVEQIQKRPSLERKIRKWFKENF